MTRAALEAVVESSAFDSFPRFEDLWRFHVPFDTLTDTKAYEAVVAAAVRRAERVAVVGPSGSGKSSLMSFVAGPLEEGLAPIRVPVRTESDKVVTDTRAFAQHVLATVARRSREAELIGDAERDVLLAAASDRVVPVSARRSFRASLTVPFWLLQGGVAAEVASAAGVDAGFPRSGAEVLEQLGKVLELIVGHGLLPLLVIDDSDSWLRVPGGANRSRIASQFFRHTPRFLAELPCSAMFGVHEQYRTLPGYEEASDVFNAEVELPALGEDGVGRILGERVRSHCDGLGLEEVFDEEAVAVLVAHYLGEGGRSVRRAVRLANTAVRLALAEDAPIVTRPVIDSALADLGQPA